MALARKYRLAKKCLDRVFKQGKTVKGSFFFMKFLKNDLGYVRIAVIVPVRVSKKATVRNHIKRAIIEKISAGHFLEKSYDVVITATLNIVGKRQEEIKREIEQTTNDYFV